MRRALSAMAILMALALAAAAVGPVAAAPVLPSVVEVRNNFFDPQAVRVADGSTVRWTAVDGGHTVTADDGRFDSGTLREGESFAWTAGAGETVRYHCRIHVGEGMVGTVVVGDGGARPPVDDAPVLHVPSSAYPTVAAAVAAAAPGAVVRVAPGVYDEAVEVTTPRLTIEGVGDVVLDGGYRREAGISGRVNGLVVRGVAARRYLAAGVSVGGMGAVVEDVRAYENEGAGVEVAEGGLARRVHAWANRVGIASTGAVVRDSVVEGSGTGILARGAGGDVVGNTLRGGVGIHVDGATGMRAIRNTVTSARMGIVVTGPTRSVRVADNVVGGSSQVDVAWDGVGVDTCFSGNRRPDGGAPTTEPVTLAATSDCAAAHPMGVPDPFVHVLLRGTG